MRNLLLGASLALTVCCLVFSGAPWFVWVISGLLWVVAGLVGILYALSENSPFKPLGW